MLIVCMHCKFFVFNIDSQVFILVSEGLFPKKFTIVFVLSICHGYTQRNLAFTQKIKTVQC